MENNTIDKKFDRLVNSLKAVSLTDAEKIYLKNSILNSAEERAVRNPARVRPTYERSLLTKFLFKPMPIVLALMLFLGGGVSFAAEKSLPGSLLYPVKVD